MITGIKDVVDSYLFLQPTDYIATQRQKWDLKMAGFKAVELVEKLCLQDPSEAEWTHHARNVNSMEEEKEEEVE